MTDYYKVLGVNARATDREIKASYRKLAKQCHPDASGDDPAKVKRMYEVQEAYGVLSDAKKREAYDARRLVPAGTASGATGRTACKGRHGPNTGQPDAPSPDMSRFEPFFGFQPVKGTETCRDKKAGSEKPEAPVKPEEMFASFFGKIKR